MKKIIRRYHTRVTSFGTYFELRFNIKERAWCWIAATVTNHDVVEPLLKAYVGFSIPCVRGLTRAQIIATYEAAQI